MDSVLSIYRVSAVSPTHSCLIEIVVVYVYLIAQEGVKFGIYPKISLLLMLSQINNIASLVKVKISDFQTLYHNE